jgi:hypothetical protein
MIHNILLYNVTIRTAIACLSFLFVHDVDKHLVKFFGILSSLPAHLVKLLSLSFLTRDFFGALQDLTIGSRMDDLPPCPFNMV